MTNKLENGMENYYVKCARPDNDDDDDGNDMEIIHALCTVQIIRCTHNEFIGEQCLNR